ncbi:hypothetical protein [Arthrobacter sp. UYCo732]|uniref:hypothetical protein n=1 Tax=Arthrobacter sp. UYCo732 TaxID=3156336 RepID=UPI003397069E
MTAVLDFIDAAAVVLAGHATYTWNKSATRIRCDGAGCGTIVDADNEDVAIILFARHQAEQLPEPQVPSVAVLPAPDPVRDVPDIPETIAPEPVTPTDDPQHEPDLPELEPAGEPMETAVETLPEVPTKVRRDTKALTATIAVLKKGDRVTAGFNHPRYGRFTVLGTVLKGGSGLDRNQLIVGGWYINLNERAAKYLCELNIIETAGNHEFEIPKPSELTEHVGIGN